MGENAIAENAQMITHESRVAFARPKRRSAADRRFVAAAVWYRRRPAIHKRLMMLALLSSTGAPIAHVVGQWPTIGPYVLTGGMVILFLPVIGDWMWER